MVLKKKIATNAFDPSLYSMDHPLTSLYKTWVYKGCVTMPCAMGPRHTDIITEKIGCVTIKDNNLAIENRLQEINHSFVCFYPKETLIAP